MKFYSTQYSKQQGFSIVEILISLAVGVLLLAGVLSVFVGLRTTTSETASYGEMQENGRFAIHIFTEDLLRQGFWGDLSVELDNAVLLPPVPVAGADCIGDGINNGSFPLAVGAFRTIWGATVNSANMMGCITDAAINSDLIQLKRVIAAPLTAADIVNNRYYLASALDKAQIFAGDSPLPVILNSRLWEYQHHIYYVRNENQGDITVPVLVQGRLTNGAAREINFQPLIEGIEMVRFWYGVDTDLDADTNDYIGGTSNGDGVIDAFIPARNMTQALWDNDGSRIVAVKMFVLVRDILPDSDYTNNNIYQLGGNAVEDRFDAGGDNFRRLLFTSTVMLENAKRKVWN
jgi:type IV pilus assembly protein PilW